MDTTVDRGAAPRNLCELFQRTAAGLARAGVRRADTVALMLANRPEFHLVDMAVMHLGATPFSVYNTSAPEQVTYLFAKAGNRVVVTERQFLPTVRAAGGAIERIICIDDTTGVNGGVVSLVMALPLHRCERTHRRRILEPATNGSRNRKQRNHPLPR